MSKVIATQGTIDTPFFSVAAAAGGLGAIPFTTPIGTAGDGGQVARYVRIHGRLDAPVGGGSIAIRATLQPTDVKPANGSAAGNTLSCRVTSGGADTDAPNLATTAAASFSAIYSLLNNASGDSQPVPTRYVSFRLSNPGTAYTAGTVYIDTVELLD